MNRQAVMLLVCFGIAAPVMADKPEWAGSGKPPSREQVEEHREQMREKRGDHEVGDQYGKSDKQHKSNKGNKAKGRSDNDDSTELQRDIQRSAEIVEETKKMGRKWWQIWQ